jgi:hypothetical protein
MGTRGITKVIVNETIAVSQYGQWDHYPSGQGTNIYYFLQDPANVVALRAGLATHVWYPTDSELEALSRPYVKENGMMTLEMGEKYSADYPSLTRDTGADILRVIANAEGLVPIYKDLMFETEELWCEGVYTIDLDAETFTTKWDSETYTFTFDEIRSMSANEYAKKCGDALVSA